MSCPLSITAEEQTLNRGANTVTFSVTNVGAEVVTFTPNIAGPTGWSIGAVDEIPLPAGESTTFTIDVTVPDTVDPANCTLSASVEDEDQASPSGRCCCNAARHCCGGSRHDSDGHPNRVTAPEVTATVTATATAPSVSVTPTTRTPTVKPTQRPVNVYTDPGFHEVNGRQWFTKCEPYPATERCFTSIWASQVTTVNGKQQWVTVGCSTT